MTMRKTSFSQFLLSVTLILIFFSGCSAAPPPPPLNFKDDALNNQIMLSALPEHNSFQTGQTLFINIAFNTQNQIVFPNNYNLRLFIEDGEEWREIQEQPRIRLPEGDFVFSPLTSHRFPGFYVKPILPDLRSKYKLRIYISGEMESDNGAETVASFIDISLRP
jgi:hypothetical protein